MISSLISPESGAAVKKHPTSNNKYRLLMREMKMILLMNKINLGAGQFYKLRSYSHGRGCYPHQSSVSFMQKAETGTRWVLPVKQVGFVAFVLAYSGQYAWHRSGSCLLTGHTWAPPIMNSSVRKTPLNTPLHGKNKPMRWRSLNHHVGVKLFAKRMTLYQLKYTHNLINLPAQAWKVDIFFLVCGHNHVTAKWFPKHITVSRFCNVSDKCGLKKTPRTSILQIWYVNALFYLVS